MSKFQVGEIVWVKPLARRGTIRAIEGYFYFIGNGRWPQFHLSTLAEQQQWLLRRAINRRHAEHERYIRRLATVFSEPLECTFTSHRDYRHAYIAWANGFGLGAMPRWVERRYWNFMMTPDNL